MVLTILLSLGVATAVGMILVPAFLVLEAKHVSKKYSEEEKGS